MVFVLNFVFVLVFVQGLARDLHPERPMNFRRLTVYQQSIQILPLAAEIASALLNLIRGDRAANANDLLASVVRMLSTMCKD